MENSGPFFSSLNDGFLDSGWVHFKITKGSGRHNCSLCENWLRKRKMKILGKTESDETKSYMLCFSCWRGYKEWERQHGRVKPEPKQTWRLKIPINR
jgi:hypothetical protein